MDQEKKAYRQAKIVAVVIMVFAAAAFALSAPMPGNAPIFPRMASAFLFLCGLGLLIGTIRRQKKGEKPEVPAVDYTALQSPVVVFLLVVAYALGFKYIGFYATTLVITVAMMVYMGIRSIKTLALVTVILLAFLYWLFTFQLGVPMPYGFLL